MSSWLPSIPTSGTPPRFGILNTMLGQLVTNPNFHTDAADWTTGTRVLDLASPFYEYSLRVNADTISETTCDVGTALAKRTFVISLYAKADNATESVWAISGGDKNEYEMTGLSDEHYTHYTFVKTWTSWRMATSFLLHFHPTGNLWIDQVRVYEITNDVADLPSPEIEEFHFVRSIWIEAITIGGVITQFSQGYQLLGFLNFGDLTSSESTLFGNVEDSTLFMFWPHADDDFAVLCQHSNAGTIRHHTISSFNEDSTTLFLIESVDLLNAQRVVAEETS